MSATDRKLFGTDGIRGKAGDFPLTAETVVKLGQAAADVLLENQKADDWPTAVIGKDTRQSGDMLEAAIAAGLNSRGVDVRLAGVIPTPAIAFLTRETRASFGIVISASHNPFYDNGIKFFGPDGYKLNDDIEKNIETRLLSEHDEASGQTAIGRTAALEDAADRYLHFATHGHDPDLFKGLTVALDAANGSAFQTSSAILEALGAEVTVFHNEPNGLNINEDCGCTHSSRIEEIVSQTGAMVGVSHDGDADRVLLCDEKGNALDGDEMMAIAAVSMLAEETLKHKTLVTTVMSNAGLDVAVEAAGGKVIRTGVGDRYVVEEMKRGDYNFGGEQSGHFIFRDWNTTGDGIISAIQILAILKNSGKPLSELRTILKRFPQVQRNVRVEERRDLESLESVQAAVAQTRALLGDRGRILMRYSGTEPLLRILVEGENLDEIEREIEKISETARLEIGEQS